MPQRLAQFTSLLLSSYPDESMLLPIIGNLTCWFSNYESLKWALQIKAAISVCYRPGWGGFSPAKPRPHTGPGGIFFSYHRPAPSGSHPHSFPRLGPVCHHQFLTGTCLGGGWGGGLGGAGVGNAKKYAPPRAIEWGGAGKMAGVHIFPGPEGPVTNPSSAMMIVRVSLSMNGSLMLSHFKSLAWAERTPGGSWEQDLVHVWLIVCAHLSGHTKFHPQDPPCVRSAHARDLYICRVDVGGQYESNSRATYFKDIVCNRCEQ